MGAEKVIGDPDAVSAISNASTSYTIAHMLKYRKPRRRASHTLKCLVSLALLFVCYFMCYWCTQIRVISSGAMQRTALLATAKKKAQRFGMLILLYINDAYYTTTLSFLCNLDTINSTYIDTLLTVTSSSHTASKLKRAFPKISVQTITFSENNALGFNDFAYYKLIAERLRIQNMLIQFNGAGRKVAFKTGTSHNWQDVWTIQLTQNHFVLA